MANNFNGLYEGGAVAVNSMPYVQMYQQIKARNDAKKEAIDNYYRDLSKNLTSEGMDNQDVDSFVNKVNTWKQYVTQNRGVLSNPNDPNYSKAVTTSSYLFNDAHGYADKSKDKIKQALANREFLNHPEYSLTDNTVMGMHKATLPLDKGYEPFDASTVAYNPKANPITTGDYKKWDDYAWGGLKMDDTGTKTNLNPSTHSKEVFKTSAYSPEALQTMHDRVVGMYGMDTPFKNEVDKVASDPKNYDVLNAKFKSVFGHDLDIKHPEEFGVSMFLRPTTAQTIQDKNFSPTNIKINVPKEDQITPSLDNYISQLQANAKPVNLHKNGKVVAENYLVEPDKNLSEVFAVKKGTQTLYPDQIQMQKDGSVLPLFYKTIIDPKDPTRAIYARGSDGNYIIDEGLSLPVSNTQFRIKLAKELFGEKGVMNVMKSNTSQSQMQPKTQQKQTKTIKRSDIGTKATAAGYTAKEYEQLLIKNGIKIID